MPRFHSRVDGIAPSSAPLSQIVEAGDLVYFSGQVPFDAEGKLAGESIEAQARQALDNLRTSLRSIGLGVGHVIKVNAFLADFTDAPAWNAAYRHVFDPPYPVRTTVGATLPGFLIEVEAVAWRGS